jgi:alpha-N-arabinofuranosidase
LERIVVRSAPGAHISGHIYGHFAEHLGRCIYEGFWVGEDSDIPNVRGIRRDVVEALRRLGPTVLRWPGGCFADEYHWKDGIGPRSERPSMVNTHWGRVVESNHFGTHEFFDLCEMLGADPYICGNVGSGTVSEMQEWVEYCTFDGESPPVARRRANGREWPWRLPFFGVGNENWGCGGSMRAEYYADVYRRYQTYVRDLGGNRVFKIACGPNGGDEHWTEVLMREAGRHMHGLSLHYYTHPARGQSRSATDFGTAEWYSVLAAALRMDDLLRRHGAIMDRHDPGRRVALVVDEWGTWYDVEPGTNPGFLYQQNTVRDALAAAVTLHAFHAHAHRVRMANIAQTVNVLQAMALTRGPELVLTPTYHVFEMYRVHQGATALPVDVECEWTQQGEARLPLLHASASRDAEGRIHLSACNLDPESPHEVVCQLVAGPAREATGRVLTGESITAHNTFEAPAAVAPAPFHAAAVEGGAVRLQLPPRSVAVVAIR